MKKLIVFNMAQLIRIFIVTFESPIRRGGEDKMYGFVRDKREVSCIPLN